MGKQATHVQRSIVEEQRVDSPIRIRAPLVQLAIPPQVGHVGPRFATNG